MRNLLFILFITMSSFISAQSGMSSQKIHALRLHPGDDIKLKLMEYVKEKKIKAGYIITCVGSLTQANIRLSNRNETRTWKETFEIVSLTGTLSPDGNHIHISVADKDGKTIGGHMMDGCLVYTTAEIVIGEANDLVFSREEDSATNLKELKIAPKPTEPDDQERVNKKYPK
jgi:predicted DNA-binding protein with PD1-like motif